MSKRLRDNICLIHFLSSNITTAQFKTILKSLTNDQVNVISEIAANVLFGNIPISSHHKKILKPFKSKIESLGNATTSLVKRKRLITKEPNLVKSILLAAKPLLKTLLG